MIRIFLYIYYKKHLVQEGRKENSKRFSLLLTSGTVIEEGVSPKRFIPARCTLLFSKHRVCVFQRRRKPRVAKEGGWIDVCSRMPSNQPCCRLFDPREIAPPLVKRFLVASLFSLPSSSFSLPCNFRSQLPYPLFLSHPLLLPPPQFLHMSHSNFDQTLFASIPPFSLRAKLHSQFFTFNISSPQVIIHNSLL